MGLIEMFEDIPIIMSIICVIILGLVFIMIDGLMSTEYSYNGVVIDKHYISESHRTGTGVGSSAGGQMVVVVTSESEPEKFLVMVKTNTSEVFTVKCNAELYYSKKIGDNIDFTISKGRFTKANWSINGNK